MNKYVASDSPPKQSAEVWEPEQMKTAKTSNLLLKVIKRARNYPATRLQKHLERYKCDWSMEPWSRGVVKLYGQKI